MTPSRIASLLLAATLSVSFAACGDDSPTTPTPPTGSVTETFSGTLTVNGAATHQFRPSGAGPVTVTLTSLTPAARLGFSVGNWSGNACSAVLSNDFALAGDVLNGTASATAALCVRIYDTGYLSEPVQYAITVTHP
jgi:predicted small lipoprotein YifL